MVMSLLSPSYAIYRENKLITVKFRGKKRSKANDQSESDVGLAYSFL